MMINKLALQAQLPFNGTVIDSFKQFQSKNNDTNLNAAVDRFEKELTNDYILDCCNGKTRIWTSILDLKTKVISSYNLNEFTSEKFSQWLNDFVTEYKGKPNPLIEKYTRTGPDGKKTIVITPSNLFED